MDTILKKNKGITLIELLVALVISSILVAGLYRTLIGQQKTFNVQDQVVDMQQNVRAAINRMMTEIRMAGFGNVAMLLPAPYGSGLGVNVGGHNYTDVVTPNYPVANSVAILYGICFYWNNGGVTEVVSITSVPAPNQVTVNSLTDSQGNVLFEAAPSDRQYVSIGGLESFAITSIAGNTLTLSGNLTYLNHLDANGKPVDTHGNLVIVPVYGIRAVSYQVDGTLTLLRDEIPRPSTQALAQPQPVADDIDNLGFVCFGADGVTPTNNPPDFRTISVTLRARTEKQDPDLKNGDGYRRRQIASNVHLRNMGISP